MDGWAGMGRGRDGDRGRDRGGVCNGVRRAAPDVSGTAGQGQDSPGRARRVLVLGGAGFIGRHAVAALLAAGAQVVVGSRHPHRIDGRLPGPALGCARIEARMERCLHASEWHPHLDGIDVVLNCVGILRERGRETYDRVHHLAPAALAAACRRRGIRLVHVSALGLEADARSGFIRSKRDGEHALMASGADICLVRPSLLDGEGGYGARWLRALARLPVHALPADATGRIAVLDVRDLGQALATLALHDDPAWTGGVHALELGGLHERTLHEHLAALRRLQHARPALHLHVPGWLARMASHLCDLLHWSPFSFGHWELLRRDNRPRHNALPELLGRKPRAVGAEETMSGPTPMAEPA